MKKFLVIGVAVFATLISFQAKAQIRFGIGLNFGFPGYYYPYGNYRVAPRVIVASPPIIVQPQVVAPQQPTVIDSTQPPVVVQPQPQMVMPAPQVIIQSPYYYPYYAPNVVYIRPAPVYYSRYYGRRYYRRR